MMNIFKLKSNILLINLSYLECIRIVSGFFKTMFILTLSEQPNIGKLRVTKTTFFTIALFCLFFYVCHYDSTSNFHLPAFDSLCNNLNRAAELVRLLLITVQRNKWLSVEGSVRN